MSRLHQWLNRGGGRPSSRMFTRNRLLTGLCCLTLGTAVASAVPVSQIELGRTLLQGLVASYGSGGIDSRVYTVPVPDHSNPGAKFLMGWVPLDPRTAVGQGGGLTITLSMGDQWAMLPLDCDFVNQDGSVTLMGALTGDASLTGVYSNIDNDALADPTLANWTTYFWPNSTDTTTRWLFRKSDGSRLAAPPQYASSIALFAGETIGTGFAFGNNWGAKYPGASGPAQLGGTVRADIQGELKAQFEWIFAGYVDASGDFAMGLPPGAGPVPASPPGLNLLMDTTVAADAAYSQGYNYLFGSGADAYATNSFGDEVSVAVDPSDVWKGDLAHGQQIHKRRLQMVPVVNGVATVTMSGNTSRFVNNRLPLNWGPLRVTADAAVYGTARVDDRAVAINFDAFNNFDYPDNYRIENGVRTLNQRKFDGSIRLDTVGQEVCDSWFYPPDGEAIFYPAPVPPIWHNVMAMRVNLPGFDRTLSGLGLGGFANTEIVWAGDGTIEPDLPAETAQVTDGGDMGGLPLSKHYSVSVKDKRRNLSSSLRQLGTIEFR